MSSVASRQDTHHSPMDDKRRQQLVRTSSIERIRRFNTYLCTQHYYVVPAILAWLRSSQDVLHRSVEKTILHFRSLVITAVFHRLLNLDLKAVSCRTTLRLRTACRSYEVDTKCLKGLIYVAVAVLACQLSFCVFVVCSTVVPVGMVFLILCIVYTVVLFSKELLHFQTTKARCKRQGRSKLKAH